MNQDYASLITQFPLLRGLTVHGAKMLMDRGTIAHYAAGETLFLEGAAPDSVILILEGQLEVYVTRNDQERVLVTPGPGTIVGELAVLCGIQRAASVRALEASTVLKWQAEEFRHLLISNTFISERIFREALSGLIAKEKSLLETLSRQ
jgi:CRP/FNR family cyclic AMP-dependent transcriptional regulator